MFRTHSARHVGDWVGTGSCRSGFGRNEEPRSMGRPEPVPTDSPIDNRARTRWSRTKLHFFQINAEQSYVSRGDPADPAGLAECAGPNFVELLERFRSKTQDVGIVYRGRNRFGFGSCSPCYRIFLPSYVPFVLMVRFQLVPKRSRELPCPDVGKLVDRKYCTCH